MQSLTNHDHVRLFKSSIPAGSLYKTGVWESFYLAMENFELSAPLKIVASNPIRLARATLHT